MGTLRFFLLVAGFVLLGFSAFAQADSLPVPHRLEASGDSAVDELKWLTLWDQQWHASEETHRVDAHTNLYRRALALLWRVAGWTAEHHEPETNSDYFEIEWFAEIFYELEWELEVEAEETIAFNYGPLPPLPSDEWEDPELPDEALEDALNAEQ